MSTRSGGCTISGRIALGQFEIAHERRLHREAEETVHARVVEKLPRQVGKRGHFREVQANAKSGALPAGFVHAAAQAAAHVAGEHLVEQPPAELLGRRHLRRFDAADRMPAATDAEQEVFNLEIGEGAAKVAEAWPTGELKTRAVKPSPDGSMATSKSRYFMSPMGVAPGWNRCLSTPSSMLLITITACERFRNLAASAGPEGPRSTCIYKAGPMVTATPSGRAWTAGSRAEDAAQRRRP